MKKIKLETILKSIACVCALTIIIVAIFLLANNVVGEDTNIKKPGETINLPVGSYTIDLSDYKVEDRTITAKPNKTGVTIIYDDGTFTYIDEYTGAGENSINLGTIDISDEKARKKKGNKFGASDDLRYLCSENN